MFDTTRSFRDMVRALGGAYPNREWLSSLVYFGHSGSGDAYVWDPADLTARRPVEYRFHVLAYAHHDDPLPVGNSFWQFVQWVEADVRSWSDFEEDGSGLYFHPSKWRGKIRPPRSEVKPWLVANDGTAQVLARRIREQDRPDLFPILADALEDAGCGHADLLHFCRHGHPESDGVWVLEVLLGKG